MLEVKGFERSFEPPPVTHCRGESAGQRQGNLRQRRAGRAASGSEPEGDPVSGERRIRGACRATRRSTPLPRGPPTPARAGARAAIAGPAPSGMPARARRKPFSAAAPAVTGRAAWSASVEAAGRGEPAQPAPP